MVIGNIELNTSADWDTWFSFVKISAAGSGIWDLVDPAKDPEPEHPDRPKTPTFERPPENSEINREALELYKMQVKIYPIHYEAYDRKKRAVGNLMKLILDTVALQHITSCIQVADPKPWSMLRALQARLAPMDEAKRVEIATKYHKLI